MLSNLTLICARLLKNCKIFDAVNTIKSDGREVNNPKRHHFLTNVVHQFNRSSAKSVNYVCFLHDYFQSVCSKDWPRKNEILEYFSDHLPKLSKPANARKKALTSVR